MYSYRFHVAMFCDCLNLAFKANSSILKIVEHKAKLPLLGEIESLNVSVACGAFLYETVRQRLNIKS